MTRLFLVLALALPGCAAFEATITDKAAAQEPEDTFLREMVEGVTTEDGIDYAEAMAIAKYYLARFGRQQSIITSLRDKGGYWEADVALRYAGFTGRSMTIDKATGGVTWFMGPTIRNPAELLAK